MELPSVPNELARLLAEEKEGAARKVALGFFVWLFRAVFKWVM